MSWIENRLGALEARVEWMLRAVNEALRQLRSAQQTARNAFAQAPSGGGGGGASYTANSGAGIAAGGSASLTVNSFVAGTATALGIYTVYNPFPADAVPASRTMVLMPDGAGNFVVYGVGCTG